MPSPLSHCISLAELQALIIRAQRAYPQLDWRARAAGGLIAADAVDVSIFILAYLGSPPQQEVGLNRGHGTSEQRVRAFLRGFDHGAEACLA